MLVFRLIIRLKYFDTICLLNFFLYRILHSQGKNPCSLHKLQNIVIQSINLTKRVIVSNRIAYLIKLKNRNRFSKMVSRLWQNKFTINISCLRKLIAHTFCCCHRCCFNLRAAYKRTYTTHTHRRRHKRLCDWLRYVRIEEEHTTHYRQLNSLYCVRMDWQQRSV